MKLVADVCSLLEIALSFGGIRRRQVILFAIHAWRADKAKPMRGRAEFSFVLTTLLGHEKKPNDVGTTWSSQDNPHRASIRLSAKTHTHISGLQNPGEWMLIPAKVIHFQNKP